MKVEQTCQLSSFQCIWKERFSNRGLALTGKKEAEEVQDLIKDDKSNLGFDFKKILDAS